MTVGEFIEKWGYQQSTNPSFGRALFDCRDALKMDLTLLLDESYNEGFRYGELFERQKHVNPL